MLGLSDTPGHDEGPAFDRLVGDFATGLSRRQFVMRAVGLAFASAIPAWIAQPAKAKQVITGNCEQPAVGACDGFPQPWTPSCPNPVANGKAAVYNGCGPLAGLDLPVLGHGDWIPDQPLGLADFRQACNDHDCCYGHCGSPKSECDTNALSAWSDACRQQWGPSGRTGYLLDWIGLGYCLSVAVGYYKGITGGKSVDAFNVSQEEVCDCCTCPSGCDVAQCEYCDTSSNPAGECRQRCGPGQECCKYACRELCLGGAQRDPVTCECPNTKVYCGCSSTCYEDEATCLANCPATLHCFTGICGPAAPGQC